MAKGRGPQERAGRTGGGRQKKARGRGQRGKRGKNVRGAFKPAELAYRVKGEHMTDLAEDLEAFFKVLEASESPDVDRLRAIVSRHEADPRYAPIKSVFERIQAEVQARDWMAARELAIVIFNVAWERSEEYHVGRDAFLRRIRGRDFKPLSYADPLISDRGAAMARIMKADAAALDTIARELGGPSELVIELTGNFDVIRLTRD